MYNDFYGFTEAPFNITPNPKFLFFSQQHRQAFDHLLYGIAERKGFIQLTGEVGAGKTTLCRAVMDTLGERYKTALILNPCMTQMDLLRSVLRELELEAPETDRVKAMEILNTFLLDQVQHNHTVVLLIDEAQDLSWDLLEQVRLLSNLETDQRKLLQIVLLGQPELRTKLDAPNLRQLRQRITVRYHLKPLSLHETEYYIRHRLKVAGGNHRPSFEPRALKKIQRYSQGIPRLINAVCDKTLLCGYVLDADVLTPRHVKRAIRELEGKF